MLGKVHTHMQNSDTGPLPYAPHKNQLKMDEKLKDKMWNHKTTGTNTEEPFDISLFNNFVGYVI